MGLRFGWRYSGQTDLKPFEVKSDASLTALKAVIILKLDILEAASNFSDEKAARKKLMDAKIAHSLILPLITDLLETEDKVSSDMPLIGGESLLDSMKLVEVCVALEDLADERSNKCWRA